MDPLGGSFGAPLGPQTHPASTKWTPTCPAFPERPDVPQAPPRRQRDQRSPGLRTQSLPRQRALQMASLVTTDTTWLAEQKWAQGRGLAHPLTGPLPAQPGFPVPTSARRPPASYSQIPESRTLVPVPRASPAGSSPAPCPNHSSLWRVPPPSQKQTGRPPCSRSCPFLPLSCLRTNFPRGPAWSGMGKSAGCGLGLGRSPSRP